jgi:hypothetical protein
MRGLSYNIAFPVRSPNNTQNPPNIKNCSILTEDPLEKLIHAPIREGRGVNVSVVNFFKNQKVVPKLGKLKIYVI